MVPVRSSAVWKVSPDRFEGLRRTVQKACFAASNGVSLVAPSQPPREALNRNQRDLIHWVIGTPDIWLVEWLVSSAMEFEIHRCERRSTKWCNFTQQFSDFGVECGSLGMVVSLVGDCRPPPPGNPRRPPNHACRHAELVDRCMRMAHAIKGGFCFTSRNPKSRQVLPSSWMHLSLNKHQIILNLKELNNHQYFKKNRSYSSCVGRRPVLEFDHLHSYLCGQLDVEPPPIAITNVLGNR